MSEAAATAAEAAAGTELEVTIEGVAATLLAVATEVKSVMIFPSNSGSYCVNDGIRYRCYLIALRWFSQIYLLVNFSHYY